MGTGLLTYYSEVKSEPVRWLWYPYIAIGKITLLQGDPGDGKSTMMMQLIAELSRGGSTPDGVPFGRPHRVIYQCSEDGASDTIKPRLEAAGADCHNVAFINEEVYGTLTLDDERIRDAITIFHPKLVVIDPIQSYIGNDSDLQIAGRARKLMRKIGMLASTYVYQICGWDKKLSYRVPEELYDSDSRLVHFDLKKAYELHEGRLVGEKN